MSVRASVVPSAFSIKVGMTIVLTLAFSMLAVGGLGYLKFGKTFDDLIIARLKATTSELLVPIESSLTLGLRLDELSTLPDLIRTEAASDPNILNLEVADEDGTVLFASQADEVGRPIGKLPAALTNDTGKKGDTINALMQDRELLLLAPLRNSFDQIVGTVVMHYSLAARNQAREHVLTRIAEGCALLLVLAAILAPVITQAVFAGFQGHVSSALATVTDAFDPAAAEDAHDIDARIVRFVRTPVPAPDEKDEIARDTAVILRALQRAVARNGQNMANAGAMAARSPERH